MLIFRDFTALPPSLKQGVVVIGNFDGVHLGHQHLLDEAREIARHKRAPLLMLTFEPHPKKFFQPNLPPFRLTPFRVKMEMLQTLRLDAAVVMRFGKKLASHTADEFVERILRAGFAAKHIVVGADFHFGKGRAGNPETLRHYAKQGAFAETIVHLAPDKGGEVISSSRIREYLKGGDPENAARLLGRNWVVAGHVKKGDGRARGIGFPTANMALGDYQRPMLGVYAGIATLDGGQRLKAIANIGKRPTFADGQELCEVHIPNWQGNLYGKRLSFEVARFIRPEKKFSGLDALKAQIAEDVKAV